MAFVNATLCGRDIDSRFLLFLLWHLLGSNHDDALMTQKCFGAFSDLAHKPHFVKLLPTRQKMTPIDSKTLDLPLLRGKTFGRLLSCNEQKH